MPNDQAGVAAGVASTSRQIGQALGVAIIGSILGRRPPPTRSAAHLAAASHPAWWLIASCGVAVLGAGRGQHRLVGAAHGQPAPRNARQRLAWDVPSRDRDNSPQPPAPVATHQRALRAAGGGVAGRPDDHGDGQRNRSDGRRQHPSARAWRSTSSTGCFGSAPRATGSASARRRRASTTTATAAGPAEHTARLRLWDIWAPRPIGVSPSVDG